MKLLDRLRRSARSEPAAKAPPATVPSRFNSVGRTHAGAVRKLNEDRYAAFAELGLWALADGMGGHQAGDVAAQMVVDAVARLASDAASPPAPGELCEAVETVNARLLAQAGDEGLQATSGSTVVALLLADGGYTCLWAGDSRAYVFRQGRLLPISRDHSMVQEMVDAGLLSPAEARLHPRSNVITRAVGVAAPLRLERTSGVIEEGDVFLLCSDGLTGAVEEMVIERHLASADPDSAADAILDAALRSGARDNVTFVLIAAA